MTIEQVAGVRARREKNTAHYDAIFDEIDAISLAGAEALAAADYAQLGSLMNICHGLLNAIEVSTPEIESMVSIARASGAAGAKLTGAGGGGSIVAICPGTQDAVEAALAAAGFETMRLDGARDGEHG
jgi:hydroxymethylglutaryl-CoA reductase